MSTRVKSILKYLLSFLLAVFLVFLVFRNISFDEFLGRLAGVNYWWVGASMLLALISHVLRAYRWNLLLNPFGYQLITYRTFLAVMSGYLANLALPRLGEVTRCGVLKKNDGVSMSTALGSVLVERLFDFLVLMLLVVVDFVVEFDQIYDYFLQKIGWENIVEHKVLYLSIVGFLIFFGTGGIIILKVILNKEFQHPALQKINDKLRDLVSGVMSIRNLENQQGFIFSTIGIWIAYFLMSFVIFFAMPETTHLGLGAGLSILAAAGVAMAAPVQGGFGAYHALVSGVLIIYGIGSEESLFFATLLHTSQVIFVFCFGGASMIAASFISRKKPTDLPSRS